ncbi:MAG: PQQ-binding-like beta-propeller repeat protein [Rhodothermales bacterium]|nr:PQQ-binding-like beta-propeller repeat protein [Rhodothermales bacterium]
MKHLLHLVGACAALGVLGSGCSEGESPTPTNTFPLAWKVRTSATHGGIEMPALADGRLFVGDDVIIEALDTETGRVLWKQNGVGEREIIHDAGRVFAVEGIIRAFDAATGTPLWTFVPAADTLGFQQASAGLGRVYVGTHRSGRVLAVDAATGRELWRTTLAAPDWLFYNPVVSTTLHEGVLYAVMGRGFTVNNFLKATYIVALDPATGRELWRYVDGDGTRPQQPVGHVSFYGDLVLYGDHYDGYVAAFNRTTRQEAWRYDLPDNWIGTTQAPTVEGDRAYVATGEGAVYAFEAATGRVIWKSERRGSFDWQALCGRWVGASFTGALSFDKATGANGPELHLSSVMQSAVVSDGRRFYFSAEDGVYAYDCTE